MSKFSIQGIEIDFPCEPYREQLNYMEKVIECLLNRKFGVLESPTGTGKTLSLLCSTLSWLRYQRNVEPPGAFDPPVEESMLNESEMLSNVIPKYLFPRIIYASRTHSQLSKAMLELQKTLFKSFKVTILGSRDQMCIHPQVMKETNLTLKNALCTMHMKVKSCNFGNNVDKAKDDITFAEGITDIEDLITKSRKKFCCPYYMAKELQEKADVIFMPYNYLFDYHIRKALKISLVNAVVILDEAHNIDKVCEEACSVSIKSSDIALAINDVTKEMQVIYEENESGYVTMEREYSTDELCFVKEKLTSLESVIDSLPVSKDKSITRKGSYIFELFQQAGIDFRNSNELIKICSQIYEFVSSISDTNNRRGGALKKIADDLSIINSTVQTTEIHMPEKDFRVFIEEEALKNAFSNVKTWQKQDSKCGKIINYWCFNPGFSLGNVLKESVRSVILTSGTLAPIDSFVREMSLSLPVTAECTHIVTNDQVFVCKIDTGPRNCSLKLNYANRQNVEYWQELGLTLQNFFRIIPDGVLLFFPGYATLNTGIKMWRESGLWDKLGILKPIFIEPQHKSELQQVTQEYYKAIETGRGKGAVFIGVCRGKISEGLDFSDCYGRAVIVAGLPYPPLHDPKVKLKKQYIDENKRSSADLSGDIWYQLEATKAVNQAIGRVIRHSEDYGAIILCDAQFNNPSIVKNLSKWVQERIIKPRTFGESVCLLRSFFRKNENTSSVVKNSNNRQSFQSAFDQSSSGYKQSDMKLQNVGSVTNYKLENINFDSVSSTAKREPSVLLTQIGVNNPLSIQLQTVLCLIRYYESIPQLVTPLEGKSCLENLDNFDRVADLLKSGNSFQFFNADTINNENALSVLHKVLEDFEEKSLSFTKHFNLEHLPSHIFDSLVPTSSSSNIFDSNLSSNDSAKQVLPYVQKLHTLTRRMDEIVKKVTSQTTSPSSKILGDIGIEDRNCKGPAKKRKIKLEFIKIDDIQLPGSDQLSREKEKRLNETKNFLIELKATIEPKSYSQLIGLIKKFSSEQDFTETVNYLRVLFPETDQEFRSLFKRCYLLFTGKWEKEFRKYCEENSL